MGTLATRKMFLTQNDLKIEREASKVGNLKFSEELEAVPNAIYQFNYFSRCKIEKQHLTAILQLCVDKHIFHIFIVHRKC